MSKVALISGANKGLGLETGRQLAKLGYTVLLGSRDAMKGEVAARQLRGEGLDARVVKLDVTKQSDIDNAARLIAKDFGVLDVLVNNAGVMLEKGWTINTTSETKIENLRATFDANLFAVVALTNAMLPLLRKAPAARIVNVSSILGSVSLQATKGSPTYNTKLFAYNASKAALNVFTIHLAHELRATKIKVNSAHPGWVKTDLGGSGAPMSVADGAKTKSNSQRCPRMAQPAVSSTQDSRSPGEMAFNHHTSVISTEASCFCMCSGETLVFLLMWRSIAGAKKNTWVFPLRGDDKAVSLRSKCQVVGI